MPWRKGISAWHVIACYTLGHVPACIWCLYMVSSVSVSLSPCLPAVSLSKLAGFAFFPLFKRATGTTCFKCLWSFPPQDQTLLLIPVPHIFPRALLASVIRIIWKYLSAGHSWSQQPGTKLPGGNNFTSHREQKRKTEETKKKREKTARILEITEHPVFH